MTNLLKSIHQISHQMDVQTERLAFRHPVYALLLMVIGLPILTLLAVAVCTLTVAFLIAWGLGSL